MFGFGKKKLNDRLIVGIALEVSMFDSWSIDNGFGGLSKEDKAMFIERILKRENLAASSDEISMISLGISMNYDLETLREYRIKTNFDNQVTGFCNSINLPTKFYKK
jgi:hypothetical protein